MKQLIINADDYGLSDSVNKGILQCLDNGIVTDLSFMINENHVNKSVITLKDFGLNSIGIHLNFTVGKPLDKKVNSLVNKNHDFLDLASIIRKYIFGKLKRKDIYNEVKSQINFLLDKGFKISHIDSHRNIHLLPIFFVAIQDAQRDIGIKIPIRKPDEPSNYKNFSKKNWVRIFILNSLSTFGTNFTNNYKNQIITLGHDFFNNDNPTSSFEKIVEMINKHKGKYFEIPVHPGFVDNQLLKYDTYINSRLIELEFLTKYEFNQEHIKLINFNSVNNEK